ncbi:MAG: IS110 family transposase, partial [Flavitalea sp.]
MIIRGVTKRCNAFLREAIIESSWVTIRKDPAMLMKYNEYCRRMNSNKAIIRIAKHLLSRIRYVWNNQKEYQRGVVS